MTTSSLRNLTALPLGDLTELMSFNREFINAAAAFQPREPTRLVTYERISSDPDDDEEGVEEQRLDLTRWGARRYPDAVVVGHYRDDDRSAYRENVVREEFERMLRDAKAGVFDGVLVRDSDRLYRRLDELPRITRDLVPYAQIVARMEGEVDLATAAGILRAQMLGAVAEHESRRKAERVADNARHRAQNGRMTTSTRPFGWAWKQPCDGVSALAGGECEHKKPHRPGQRPRQGARAGLVPHSAEGPALAEAYQMVAGGASLRQVARWLEGQGFTGAMGAQLRAEQVGSTLRMPRHAGLVAHRDRLVADAVDGHRLVDQDLWQQVQLILSDPGRRTSPGRPANTALSGIAVCGRCGGPMNASNKHSAGRRLPDGARAKGPVTPVYICAKEYHLTKSRALVDDYVLATIGEFVIDHAALLAGAAATDAGPAETLARREVARLDEQIKGYQRLAAEMDPDDLVAILTGLRADLVEAQQRSTVVAARPGVVRLTAAEDVQAAWQTLTRDPNREPLRQVIRELVEAVTVHPRPGSGRPLPVDQAVTITWQPWVAQAAE